MHFLTHSPWSMLFSREQKCSGHTSTLFFLGGGEEEEVYWVNRALEGSILKLDIQRALVGAVIRAPASCRFGLGLNLWDYAIPRLVWCSPQREYFPIPIPSGISNQEPVCRGCTTTKSLFVCLFIYLILISFLLSLLLSLRPFALPFSMHLFARRLFHAAIDRGRFPFTKNSGLKFWKFHVLLSGTVHTGCTDVTETTERLIRAKYNTRAKIKQKSPEKRPTH